MIELVKKNKSAFIINIGMNDIEELISFIIKKLNNERGEIYILHLGQKKRFDVEISERKDEVLITKNSITIYMDVEELEYLKERLKDSLISKSFYPAEICERYYKKIYVTFYCNII